MHSRATRLLASLVLLTAPLTAMAIEEAEYQVLLQEGDFEVREYAPHIVAETVVDADFEDAGSEAFQRLFKYISGNNQAQQDIAMTAPVGQQQARGQEPEGQDIAMTAPVGQQQAENGWAISFMMPASFTLDTLPQPKDPKVTLRQVPARTMAAIRYSGFWSEERYQAHLAKLQAWMAEQGYTATGNAEWARYNPPLMPWFLRRNEILIPMAGFPPGD